MHILRGIKDSKNPFIQINKKLFEDATLSLKAKGLIGYCLSKNDDWTFHVSHLKTALKEKEDAIYAIIQECIAIGYGLRWRIRDPAGKIVSMETVLSDSKEEILKKKLYLEKEVKKTIYRLEFMYSKIEDDIGKIKKCLPFRDFPEQAFPEQVLPDTTNIDNTNNEYTNNPPPLSPPQKKIKPYDSDEGISLRSEKPGALAPSEKVSPVHKRAKDNPYENPPRERKGSERLPPSLDPSLRSSEEEDFLYKILENTALSPKEKKRLCKDYPEEAIVRAIKLAEGQPIKKSYMALLIHILDNPAKWPDSPTDQSNNEPLTENQRKALRYNEELRKLYPNLAEVNMKKIRDIKGPSIYFLNVYEKTEPQTSLNSDCFDQELKQATIILRKLIGNK